jgi:hypothetical protein
VTFLQLSALIVLFYLILSPLDLDAGTVQSATPQLSAGRSSSVPITFESLLQNPPSVEEGSFEVRYGQTNNVTRTFIEDGANFLMSQVQTGVERSQTNGLWWCGEFANIRWHGGGWGTLGFLTLFDPAINTNSSDPMNPMNWDGTSKPVISQNRETIDLMMHLGIPNMVTGSVIWHPGDTNFIASYDGMDPGYVVKKQNGNPVATNNFATTGKLAVQLTYKDGVPSTALVIPSNRGPLNRYLISYRYDPNYFGGRLPSGWTVYSHYFGAEPEKQKRERYALEVKKLTLASGPMSLDEFDPRKALAKEWRSVDVWSNNTEYLVGDGQMSRLLSASSFQALEVRKNIENSPGSLARARILVLSAFLLMPLIFVRHWRKIKQQKT